MKKIFLKPFLIRGIDDFVCLEKPDAGQKNHAHLNEIDEARSHESAQDKKTHGQEHGKQDHAKTWGRNFKNRYGQGASSVVNHIVVCMWAYVKNLPSSRDFRKMQNLIFLLLAVGVFLTFFYLTLWGENGLLRLVRLYRVKAKMIEANNSLLLQNLEYLQKIRHLKEVKYIEQTARTDLGFVRPNEVVYVFDAENQAPKTSR